MTPSHSHVMLSDGCDSTFLKGCKPPLSCVSCVLCSRYFRDTTGVVCILWPSLVSIVVTAVLYGIREHVGPRIYFYPDGCFPQTALAQWGSYVQGKGIGCGPQRHTRGLGFGAPAVVSRISINSHRCISLQSRCGAGSSLGA